MATEAAGEGINLQFCKLMVNWDIPWNPNRLEQRMGRIHRYGQHKDCLIFNFVATNTVEGRVLQRLLEKLQAIRDALDDDAVFNVVGEILPSAHVERVLRDYYAGRLGDVLVVGFDNIPSTPYFDPPLTTLHQPNYELGRTGARLLIDLISGEPAPSAPIRLETELVIRRSCGAQSAPDLEQNAS